MAVHKVVKSECLTQIAHQYGFKSADAIWTHPDNRELRQLRNSPNILHPGDVVTIPDRVVKQVDAATGQSHKFVVKSPKKMFRLVLRTPSGKPIKDAHYRLIVGSTKIGGTTGEDGVIEHSIPVQETAGQLTLNGETFPVAIGAINPISNTQDEGVSGVHARLANLGFTTGQPGEATVAAVRAYRKARKLDPDGGIDAALEKTLKKDHGC